MPRQDGWGKFIRYSVTPAFANAGFTLTTVANRTVQTRDGGGAAVFLAGQAACNTANQCVPAVIFSQGKLNWGRNDGGDIPDGSATNADEDVNDAGPTNYLIRRHRDLAADRHPRQPHDQRRQAALTRIPQVAAMPPSLPARHNPAKLR
jgi:hypothetical protein